MRHISQETAVLRFASPDSKVLHAIVDGLDLMQMRYTMFKIACARVNHGA